MGSRMRMVYPIPGGRLPQNEDRVSFKKSKEFKLRDYVKERVSHKMTPCLHELSSLINCLKENSYQDNQCGEEAKGFNDCFMKALEENKNLKERRKDPNKLTCNKDLISIEVNAMLKKYQK